MRLDTRAGRQAQARIELPYADLHAQRQCALILGQGRIQPALGDGAQLGRLLLGTHRHGQRRQASQASPGQPGGGTLSAEW